MIKILFICGSLEPGRDGVGDYTRRLSGELIRQGHSCAIMAIMDKVVKVRLEEFQESEFTTIPVLRLPFSNGFKLNAINAKPWIDAFNPDWISLQFVHFSFHPKGLPFGFSKVIGELTKGLKLHLMLHELWVGMNIESSLKLKIWGKLQREMLRSLIQNCNPNIIHTQSNLYQYQLKQMGYNPKLLPLFSNIKLSRPIVKVGDSKVIKFAFFGGIHPSGPVKEFIGALKFYIKSIDEVALKFVFIGNCGDAITEWTSVLDSETIAYEIFGFCSDEKITDILSSCDYALTTTPFITVQKSGSVAAYLQHQLPIICVSRKWGVENFNNLEIDSFSNVIEFKKDIPLTLNKNKQLIYKYDLKFIANMFLEEVNK